MIRRILIGIIIGFGIYGLCLLKYKVWRAEHPQAKTWTFFIRG